MGPTTPADIASAYFSAWSNKHINEAASYIAADAVFETPINSYPDKDSFIQAVAFTANAVVTVTLLAVTGNDRDSILLYDMELPEAGVIRMAEHFQIKDGKIVMIRHVHDTAMLRASRFDKG